ncbi:MAG: NAD-dependent succinate-semialdehyde dehydrogenase [Candidatus Kerfeldbacteria bacterium]|nr:NAD-dependent succinate-semialdehyde dehydrogenase [Candidatus Kerfeldbacteria bacterium]
MIVSKNPATEEVIATFKEDSDKEVQAKLALAEKAFEIVRPMPFEERAKRMYQAAALLRERSQKYGELMTKEMGKPIAASIAEVEKCAWVCEYYAERAKEILQDETIETDAQKSYVRFDPLGVVLAVMPWNFPFWQVIRFAAPALMAGNVGILKHASNVPQSALALQEVFLDAGFPNGAFQAFLVGSHKVESIIQDHRVKAVTLTGSEYAGSQVAMTAGREIKKTVLELGGSDPFIVLADADLPYACEIGANARLQNAGQSCIAAKRFIIVKERYEEFIERYKEKYERFIVDDPMDTSTNVGPLATEQVLKDVMQQVDESVKKGARVVVGGKRKEGKGYFYEPTILADVQKGMPVYDDEVFGPVAAIIKAKDEEDAIRIANDTSFGLGSSLWTENTKHAEEIASHIEAGNVFINGMVKSDPRLPFGGMKRSGYGRELSHYGMKEFVNIKTVWIGAPTIFQKE